MANPKHVELVMRGSKYINEYRKKHPYETLDLSGANLRNANLREANLSNSNLEKADLSLANLVDVNLQKANLKNASLLGAYLIGANLSEANFIEAKLGAANLDSANISNATFYKADLTRTHLRGATIYNADFSKATLIGACLWSAQLSGSIFKEANLASSILFNANLSKADFSKASFFEANLSGADLSQTNFSNADLSFAEIKFVKLMETNFSGANLFGAKLEYLDFSKMKIDNAIMGETILADCILPNHIGLETIKHEGSSSIDFLTLLNSFMRAGGNFPPDVELFLLNAGIPKHLLDIFPQIVAKMEYCYCFVCYGTPNKKFAEKLVNDLRKLGVPCWLYSMDYTPGKWTWREITQKRREADKMIVICSAKSLIRDGVLKEIEEQIDENPEKIIPISLDDIWKQEGFQVKRGGRDLKPFLLEKNYVDFSDKSKYQDSLRKLLKALKREQ